MGAASETTYAARTPPPSHSALWPPVCVPAPSRRAWEGRVRGWGGYVRILGEISGCPYADATPGFLALRVAAGIYSGPGPGLVMQAGDPFFNGFSSEQYRLFRP